LPAQFGEVPASGGGKTRRLWRVGRGFRQVVAQKIARSPLVAQKCRFAANFEVALLLSR